MPNTDLIDIIEDRVEEVDLSHLRIEAEGARKLVEAFQSNTRMKKLNLTASMVTDEIFQMLAEGIIKRDKEMDAVILELAPFLTKKSAITLGSLLNSKLVNNIYIFGVRGICLNPNLVDELNLVAKANEKNLETVNTYPRPNIFKFHSKCSPNKEETKEFHDEVKSPPTPH